MIVDAGVALKWLVPEEDSPAAKALIGEASLSAPTLLLAEIGNALWKKKRRGELYPEFSPTEALTSVSALVAIRSEVAVVPRASAIAERLDHAIYDCIYLALAEFEAITLVSADRRFVEKVRQSQWRDLVRPLMD